MGLMDRRIEKNSKFVKTLFLLVWRKRKKDANVKTGETRQREKKRKMVKKNYRG